MKTFFARFSVCAVLGAGALPGFPSAVHAAENVIVEARMNGTAVAVHAHATVKAPHPVMWQTLTDYDHLALFIPGMKDSRVVGRRGGAAVVAQKGVASALLFQYSIDMVVESVERPPNTIEIHAIRGNLKQLDGRYQIEKGLQPGTYTLRWIGLIEPGLAMPSFVSLPVIRANIADQFHGMVREIERRAAQVQEVASQE